MPWECCKCRLADQEAQVLELPRLQGWLVRLPCGLGREGSRPNTGASPSRPGQAFDVEELFLRSRKGHVNHFSQSAPSCGWIIRSLSTSSNACLKAVSCCTSLRSPVLLIAVHSHPLPLWRPRTSPDHLGLETGIRVPSLPAQSQHGGQRVSP